MKRSLLAAALLISLIGVHSLTAAKSAPLPGCFPCDENRIKADVAVVPDSIFAPARLS